MECGACREAMAEADDPLTKSVLNGRQSLSRCFFSFTAAKACFEGLRELGVWLHRRHRGCAALLGHLVQCHGLWPHHDRSYQADGGGQLLH